MPTSSGTASMQQEMLNTSFVPSFIQRSGKHFSLVIFFFLLSLSLSRPFGRNLRSATLHTFIMYANVNIPTIICQAEGKKIDLLQYTRTSKH